jgi:hypothetical protein
MIPKQRLPPTLLPECHAPWKKQLPYPENITIELERATGFGTPNRGHPSDRGLNIPARFATL